MSNTDDDSSHDNSSSDEESTAKPGINLTSFLFGNIDRDGKLEDDGNFLDETSKKKLGGLSTVLGLKNIIEEVKASTSSDTKVKDEDYEEGSKVPEAEDYSTINEALTDDSSSDEEEVVAVKKEQESSPTKTADSKVITDKPASDSADTTPTTIKEELKIEENIKKEPMDEAKLMPPPTSAPVATSRQPPPQINGPIKKPLASMLPEKYKNVDIQGLFPEFRENQVLRFSRLFPIKSSYRPRIWKNVKRRFKTEQSEAEPAAGGDEPAIKRSKDGEWTLNIAPPPSDPDAYVEDQAVRFHRPFKAKKSMESSADKDAAKNRGPQPTDWRNGPAEYWYDMLGLPDKVEDFDYGLKVETDNLASDQIKLTSPNAKDDTHLTEDAFLMVTQANWEDEVIWNGDDIKHKVLQKLNSKTNAAGWVPSSFNRTAGAMSGKLSGIKPQTMQMKRPANDEEFHSIFPVENEELVYGRWEDEVIWDHEHMPVKIEPKMVTVDPNDDNIILGMPEDIDPSTLPQEGPLKKVKIIQKHVKKSRMMLNKSGIINVIEEESPPPAPKMIDKDPYNLSNDEFYTPKTHESQIKVSTGGFLQHATPVVELRAPFVPTFIGEAKLRLFHRLPLKRYSHGNLADINKLHGVSSLQKYMKKRAKEREKEREAAGGGDIFFMRTPEDVSGKDGDIVLMEYMEEYPPLLSLVGMASKIKNYFKRKPGGDKPGDEEANKYQYGELTIAHTSPFLGQMAPGQTIQAIESNMYRAPVYQHKVAQTDFLIIRTRNEFSVREVDGVFTVGQECPLYEVPGPNSKKANNFTRDFLQVFIYRLFWSSKDNPRRIKMDVIKRAFPAHSESSIRKRLKPCAEFHRTGHDSNWWVIKTNFRLPTEDEIRSMVSPEQCCSYFSMIAAEQRLKDAGYGEKSLLAPQDDDDEDTALKLDVEIQVAPWNTTRAYILAMKAKCLLQLTGPADPTGPAGEGFSYVRIPNKPTNKENLEPQQKRTVTGTDADLRKLPLKEARAILRQNGVPEEEIKKLSRWEVIDVVRTLSTEKVKAGEEGDQKFSRGNRHSIAEHQERYREDCQRIFDVQNKVLASDEVLTSDEDDSSEEEDGDEGDLEDMGRSLETFLSNKKSSTQIMREREEKERKNLHKELMEGGSKNNKPGVKNVEEKKDFDEDGPPKVLKITRTFKNANGKEYTRTEIVRKPIIVQTYVRVRETKDEEFIRQFATIDEAAKEEMKKEKRRIQEQLRRIKRNQEKERIKEEENRLKEAAKKAKLAAKGKNVDMKVKCGACGSHGHMKTNRACPKFNPNDPENQLGNINVALTEQDEEELLGKELIDIEHNEGELINVDGTKMTVKSSVLEHAENIRRQSMILKVPKQAMKQAQGIKRRRAGTVEHCDYLTNKNYKNIKRRRTDPLVELGTVLGDIHSELHKMDEALQFLQPVNTKKVVDYLDKIETPMDLQTIKERILEKRYISREEFLTDVLQIKINSEIYNGPDDMLTNNAKKLLAVVIDRFTEREDHLINLEKQINPLLDDDDQKKFSYILKRIIEDNIKPLQESWPFMKPVNKKAMRHYYEKIKEPMDLETISTRIDKNVYHSRNEFLRDMELIFNNSKEFNGEASEYTLKAKKLLDITKEKLYGDSQGTADAAKTLEDKLKEIQQRAIERAEVDSLGTSLGEMDESSNIMEPSTSEEKSMKNIKRDKKSRRAKMNKTYNELNPDGERSNLEDDLQYSSDDHFGDFDDDEDEEDEDWQEVENEPGFTVTMPVVDAQTPRGYYQEVQAEDGRSFQIEAPNLVIQQQEEVIDEEEVDENYDPTFFLQSLQPTSASGSATEPAGGGSGGDSTTIVTGTIDVSAAVNAAVDNNEDVVVNLEPTEIVEGQSLSNLEMLTSDGNIVPANNALDVITEDLDISDDSDDDHEPMEPNHETKQPDPPPPSEEANAPNNASSEADDDFMMF